MNRTFLIASISAVLILALLSVVGVRYRALSDVAIRLTQPILPLSNREIEIRIASLEILSRDGLLKADRVLETADEVPAEYAKLWDRLAEPIHIEVIAPLGSEDKTPTVRLFGPEDLPVVGESGSEQRSPWICGTDVWHQDELLRAAILKREPPEVIAALVSRHPILQSRI